MVLSLLFRLGSPTTSGWSSSVTITPLRFATSVSRSSRRDSVEEIEGKVACVYIDRGVLRFAEGGRDRGCELEGTTEARGEEGGVDMRE